MAGGSGLRPFCGGEPCGLLRAVSGPRAVMADAVKVSLVRLLIHTWKSLPPTLPQRTRKSGAAIIYICELDSIASNGWATPP